MDQVFYNPHQKDMEAIYSFPVPDKAAVSEFVMWIDGKPVTGEVLEKKRAREVYEDQKSQGNDSGITEKNEYKTFEITVSPVRAQQEARIRLSYYQPAHVDTGIGRYVYPLEEGGVDDHALAFWTTNDRVTGAFSLDLEIRSAYPLSGVRLPNHPQAQVTQQGDKWLVHMDNHLKSIPVADQSDPALTINNGVEEGEDTAVPAAPVAVDNSFRLDKDVVVYFRHAENLPGTVDLVAYKEAGAKRGTFMLTVTPGMDLQPITEGRDWVFILDISGSMKGKYATLAEGVSRTLKNMTDRDRFRIVLFNSSVQELTNGFVIANPQNIQTYTDRVAAIQPNQGTNLYEGMQLGLKALDADRTSSLILVTDGVANVGETQQRKFLELIRKYDVRLFTFIMGNSANKPLLQALTRESNGFAANISNSDDIIGKILEAQSKVNHQSLHGAEIKISGVKTTDVMPKKIGNVYRGQQLIVFGHYFGDGVAKVELTGKISGEDKVYSTEFEFPKVSEEHPEIERLWAYSTIESLMQEINDFGEDKDLKNSVTDLGVEFSLVTDYTSMVVVKEDVFQKLGIDRRNQKRLKKEQAARTARRTQPVRSRRVDQAKPMFNNNQPTYSGGAGALGPGSLLALSPLLWGFRRKKNDSNTDTKTGKKS